MKNHLNAVKTERMKVKLTKEEKKLAQSYADKETQGNLSAYIRKSTLECREEDPRVLAALEELEVQIKKIGRSINQLTRSYHAAFFTMEDKEQLFKNMERLEELLWEHCNLLDQAKRKKETESFFA